MAGAGVEPDLNARGIDLCSAVANVVRHDVEGSGLGFRLDVCPRVSVTVIGVSILVATRGRTVDSLYVTWLGGWIAAAGRSGCCLSGPGTSPGEEGRCTDEGRELAGSPGRRCGGTPVAA